MASARERAPVSVVANAQTGAANLWKWAVLAVLALGVALRFWQYLANPSIWVDEAAIARNVLDRTVVGLFRPLDYAQVAPPGFLLAVKLSSALFGPSEYALRLTPFVFGVAGVLLFWFVAQSFLARLASVVATFMFATAIPLIFFSSNLKQYSGDVAVTLAIISTALVVLNDLLVTRWSMIGLAAFGVVALAFSQAAVFPLALAGAVVVEDAFVRHRQDKWNRLLLVCGWAVAVLGTVAYGYRSMNTADGIYMHKFWEQGFMPATPTKAANWLWTTAQTTFSGPQRGPNPVDGSLHYAAPAMFGVLFLCGVVAVLRSHREKGVLVVGPIMLALAASAAGAYPVRTRVSLFLVPLLVLIVVCGLDALSRMVLRPRVGAFGCLLLLPFAANALVHEPPPILPQHMRPVLRYVVEHRQPDDALWVSYGAGQAFEYYKRLIPIAGDVQMSDCNHESPREYLRQVDAERGRSRAWFLFANFDERPLILAYLNAIGTRLDAFLAPPNDTRPTVAAVFLYDLSNRQKLAANAADSFPMPRDFRSRGAPRGGEEWTCYGTNSVFPERNRAATEAVMRLGSQ
jgi:hypothetical protein